MTKPTGRPRGRPKTKEYVTLMARVDLALADEVKRYASLHRQPISVVIRDALTLLMEEYPFAADRSAPHRLAAHEFLSDRYESPLDTLVGETDSPEVEAIVSDTKGDISDGPQRKGGRPSSPERQQILDLLAGHPEGLSAEQIRVYIQAEKALGDTLQGMKRTGVVTTHGSGKTLRYFTARERRARAE